MDLQERAFKDGESDRWHQRNRAKLNDPKTVVHDPLFLLLKSYSIQPTRILEIGCSNGYRLAALQKHYGCQAVGIEPSPSAIEEGRREFPEIDFRIGLLSDLPIQSGEQFDLVIVCFVYHWVSRSQLLRALSETDRCVKDGGLLALGDFSPDIPQRVEYHHLPGSQVYTWKYEYWRPLVASSLYRLVALETRAHSDFDRTVKVPGKERAFFALLEKNLSMAYQAPVLTS